MSSFLASLGIEHSQGTGPRLDEALARRIRLVALDVDGVLTDGGIYVGDVAGARLEFKRFDILDGLGIKMMQRAGIVVAIITGRVSESVAIRARELGIDELVQDEHARKLPALRKMLNRLGIAADEAAFVGDDLPDIGVMREVALPATVADCTDEVFKISKLRLTRPGGQGAVREFAEILLRARGEWESLVEWYVKSRAEEPA
jgi:3-deoxy-D-manno-octulosonate 8-phosphate phosphatase (KDO 8-P phosphatase)